MGPPGTAPARPITRRWIAQRWLLDNTIRAVGMDWDQPRSLYLSAPCGPEANADFAGLRQRITKLADASPAFEAVARRREAKAQAAEAAQDLVTARENYFMASIHWGAAQWPIDENSAQNRLYNDRKRACFAKYAALADHQVEAAWIPLRDGRALPAWLQPWTLPSGAHGRLDGGNPRWSPLPEREVVRRGKRSSGQNPPVRRRGGRAGPGEPARSRLTRGGPGLAWVPCALPARQRQATGRCATGSGSS